MLNGKKTYLIAAAITIWAIGGFALGQIDANETIRLIMEAGLGASLRAGIAKGA